MFSSTEASTFQWESSVFVSPINAPALMILDVYRAADVSSLLQLGRTGWHRFLAPGRGQFLFEFPFMAFHEFDQQRRDGTSATGSP